MYAPFDPLAPEKNAYHQKDLGTRLNRYLVSTKKLIDELIERIAQLPKVDENGHSECPPELLEQFYNQIANAERALEMHLKTLREEFLPAVEEEIRRCERNLHIVSTDEGALNHESPKKDYQDSRRMLKGQLKYLQEQWAGILLMIRLAEEALEKARAKESPDQQQRKKHEVPAVSTGGGESTSPVFRDRTERIDANRTPSFDAELKDLLSLGPLGG